jgi:hypothetical protein
MRLILTYMVLFVAVIMGGCNFDKKEQCIKLDTMIGVINDSLAAQANVWGDELKIAVNTLEFAQLQPVRMKLQAYVEERMAYMQKVKNVGGSEELVKAEIEFLKTEKDIVENRFSLFEQFTDSVSMDELSSAMAYIQMGGETEQAQLAKIFKLREEYAERNGFPKYIDKY